MTTIAPLTLDRAIELAREVVAEKGADFVYRECPENGTAYVHAGGECGCLVGHILHRHGVPLEMLTDYNDLGFGLLVEEGPMAPLRPAAEFLNSAQMLQDEGKPWGRAVESAVLFTRFEGDEDDA